MTVTGIEKTEASKRGNLEKDLEKDLEILGAIAAQHELTGNQLAIVKEMIGNPSISQHKMAENVGISPRNIRSNIQKLKEWGLVIRVGSDKRGLWKILKR